MAANGEIINVDPENVESAVEKMLGGCDEIASRHAALAGTCADILDGWDGALATHWGQSVGRAFEQMPKIKNALQEVLNGTKTAMRNYRHAENENCEIMNRQVMEYEPIITVYLER